MGTGGGREGAQHPGSSTGEGIMPVLTVRVLLSRGPGIRLALGGTNRARRGEAAAHPSHQHQLGAVPTLLPHISLFILIVF